MRVGLCFTLDLENFYLLLRASGVFRGRKMNTEEMPFERILKTLSSADLMAMNIAFYCVFTVAN